MRNNINARNIDETIEEPADLLEIIHAFAEYHGTSIERIEEVLQQKAKAKGGFKEKVFLIEVKG